MTRFEINTIADGESLKDNTLNDKKDIQNQTISEDEESKTTTKPNKKEPLHKRKGFWSTTITLTISVAIGSGAGVLLHNSRNQTSTSMGSGTEGYIPTTAEINKMAANNTDFVKEYQDKAYELLNYSFIKQASYPYSLTIGKAQVVSSGVTQNIKSTTYATPETIYNQNVSASAIVSTANRFYDHLDGNVECYLQSKPEDWMKGEAAITYSYNEYMQKYGKLLKGSYYCTSVTNSAELTEATPVSDRYLTDTSEEYDASNDKSKHHVNGVVIYMIGPSSVKTSSIIKNDVGYKIDLELYTDEDRKTISNISTGNSYYSVQMRTTGGLSSRPPFKKSKLEFQLDDDFNLVSSYFYDEYTAQVGGLINSAAVSDMTQYYFHSDSDTFQNVKVSIPKPNAEDNFAGYQLFPN
ncbi:MAG: hypothetical protein K5762_05445 [Bacilli bacterium]|nr:hypothetical protein [Bacilli bacterium]